MSSNTSKPAHSSLQQRRRFLRLFGTAAAALPITVLTGCSDDPPPAPASRWFQRHFTTATAAKSASC